MIKSKEMKRILPIVLWACLGLSSAQAFEVTTHGAITQQAWARFLTVDPDVLKRLGIQDADNAFNTENYYDFRPSDGGFPLTRNSFEVYEGAIIRSPSIKDQPFSVRGWLMRGAIREDDDAASDDPSPKEDQNGDFHRVFSHFYDPVNNRGLTGLGRTLGATAADWALIPDAITPAFNFPGATPTPQRFNNFSLATFHESMWRAVTGLNQAGETVAVSADTRNTYWATTFRALGDILHLNQDMAQPQHTRNDPHAGKFPTAVTGHKSVFERYVNARVTGAGGFSTRDDNTSTANVAIGPQPVVFGTYPIPNFPRYADYWAAPDQKGLANYSNGGFFSIGTLPGNSNYLNPSTNTSAYAVKKETLTRWDGTPVLGGLLTSTHFSGNVGDNNQPALGASSVPLFAKSAWDDAAQGVSQAYAGITLTKRTYDAAIDLLLPRAVAYSAGLLQYAFRGQIEITPPAEGVYGIVDHSQIHQTDPVKGFVGFNTIKLKLRNITSNNESMSGGKLVAVAKFHRNGCYKDDLSGEFTLDSAGNLVYPPGCFNYRTADEEIVLSNEFQNVSLDPTTAQPFTFTFSPPIPINATDLFIQVVFRGKLGDEPDAVVVATKDVFEPTYLSWFNSSDQIWWNGIFYATTDSKLLPTFELPGTGKIAPYYDQTNVNVNLGFTGSLSASYLVTIAGLPPSRHSRVALLTDRSPFPLVSGVVDPRGFPPSVGVFNVTAETNQLQFDAATTTYTYRVSAFKPLRGVPTWAPISYYSAFGSGTVDLTKMPPLSDKTLYPTTPIVFQ